MNDEPIRQRARHPSTLIPAYTITEIAYRLYLHRLQPPMTPEQSVECTYRNGAGEIIASDGTRRRHAKAIEPIVRDALRVLVDMGLVSVEPEKGLFE